MKRTSCRDFARLVRATRALIAAPGRAASLFSWATEGRNCERSLSQNQPRRFHLNCEPRQMLPHAKLVAATVPTKSAIAHV